MKVEGGAGGAVLLSSVVDDTVTVVVENVVLVTISVVEIVGRIVDGKLPMSPAMVSVGSLVSTLSTVPIPTISGTRSQFISTSNCVSVLHLDCTTSCCDLEKSKLILKLIKLKFPNL